MNILILILQFYSISSFNINEPKIENAIHKSISLNSGLHILLPNNLFFNIPIQGYIISLSKNLSDIHFELSHSIIQNNTIKIVQYKLFSPAVNKIIAFNNLTVSSFRIEIDDEEVRNKTTPIQNILKVVDTKVDLSASYTLLNFFEPNIKIVLTKTEYSSSEIVEGIIFAYFIDHSMVKLKKVRIQFKDSEKNLLLNEEAMIRNGMCKFRFPLSEQAIDGQWTFTVIYDQTFRFVHFKVGSVKKPNFDIRFHLKDTKIQVCARYFFEKDVSVIATVKICRLGITFFEISSLADCEYSNDIRIMGCYDHLINQRFDKTSISVYVEAMDGVSVVTKYEEFYKPLSFLYKYEQPKQNYLLLQKDKSQNNPKIELYFQDLPDYFYPGEILTLRLLVNSSQYFEKYTKLPKKLLIKLKLTINKKSFQRTIFFNNKHSELILNTSYITEKIVIEIVDHDLFTSDKMVYSIMPLLMPNPTYLVYGESLRIIQFPSIINVTKSVKLIVRSNFIQSSYVLMVMINTPSNLQLVHLKTYYRSNFISKIGESKKIMINLIIPQNIYGDCFLTVLQIDEKNSILSDYRRFTIINNKVLFTVVNPHIKPGSNIQMNFSLKSTTINPIYNLLLIIVDKSSISKEKENFFKKSDLNKLSFVGDNNICYNKLTKTIDTHIIYDFYHDNAITYSPVNRLNNAGLTFFSTDSALFDDCHKLLIINARTYFDSMPMHNFVGTSNDNVIVRKNFDDVAAFVNKELTVGDNIINIEMPHSITSFMIYAIVASSNDILIYDQNNIIVFQEYFMKLYYPDTVSVGEVFELKVAIYSYSNISAFVQLKLNIVNNFEDYTKQFVRIIPELDHLDVYCVQSNIPTIIKYHVEFLNYHNNTFDILADLLILTNSSKPLTCNDEYESLKNVDFINVDRVKHIIKIKPSGLLRTKTTSFYNCYDETKDQHTVLFEESNSNSICYQNTDVTMIEISGNVIGFDISSIEKMIIMPYGCGEQNIAIMASVVSALELLNHSNMVDDNKLAKGRDFLMKGLQNQLTFKLMDGSYTIFQGLVNSPSERLWLSVYVYHFLNKCSKFISIDPEILNKTKNFIMNIVDNDNLCDINFDLRGFTNYNQAQKNNFLLSFIVYSICSYSKNVDICDKMIKCIIKDLDISSNTRIIIFSLVGLLKYDLEIFKNAYNTIEHLNKMENYKNASIIEIAFALELNVHLIEHNIHVNKSKSLAMNLFKLLVSKQNSNDAFGTTIETNFAINSLSKYILFQKLTNGWMVINFTFYNDYIQPDENSVFFYGNENDKNLFKQQMIKGNYQKVNISYIKGIGCNSIKITSSCYLKEIIGNNDQVNYQKQPLMVELVMNNIMQLKIKIKLSLLHYMEMPILQIERPSGFILSNAQYNPSNYFFKSESKADLDYFYFSDLPNTTNSLFDTTEHIVELIYELEHIVLNQTTKNIKLYEFYNAEKTSYQVSYTINDKLLLEITNVN